MINDKNELGQKRKVIKWIKKKNRKLPRFPSFRVFALYPKLKTRKSQKVFF